ncbi:MAG: septum formation initiator family protein [Bacteroidetes bacterium]|nr:septum formation initiator family protein [Bacteroidota bacterium]
MVTLKKILKIFINKYFVITVAFIVWMVFFDSNNVFIRAKLRDKLDDLQQEKHFYLDEIQKDSALTHKLLTDSTELERFAREKYLMKKGNEDLYLVIDSTSEKNK